jgi:cell division septum initiation protein DivIVA
MTKAQLIAENEALRAEIAALKAQLATQTQSAGTTYGDFCAHFRDAYYAEKMRQERRGVVCIYLRTLRDQMLAWDSASVVDGYIARLKAEHKIFTVVERSEELVRWAE